MAGISQAKAKHDFFLSLARDPANFLRRWTGSQRRDLEVILGDEVGEGEEWRWGGKEGVWGGEGVVGAVGVWAARRGLGNR